MDKDELARGRRRTWRRRVLLALLLGLPVVGIGWSKSRPLPVVAVEARRGKAVAAVYATGTVEPVERRTVKARTAGLLAEVAVQPGDRVARGQLLARIDGEATAAELRRSLAEAQAARIDGRTGGPRLAALEAQAATLAADLAQARRDADRLARLAEEAAVTPSELERARTRVAGLEASLAANRAQARAMALDLSTAMRRTGALVDGARARLAETEVRSPIDGVVLWRGAEPGETVSREQPLFRIGDITRFEVEALVDEADVTRIRAGEAGSRAVIALTAAPDQPLAGRVSRIEPEARRDRKAFLVHIALEGAPAGLLPGIGVEVDLVTDEREGVVVVPTDAVADGAVWVVEEGRARRRPVERGVGDLLRTEIRRGLRPGELVVIGVPALRDGQRVRARVEPPALDAAAPRPGAVQSAFGG